MEGFKSNIEKDTQENSNFRKVLYTGKHTQLVVMTLQPGEDIGLETHRGNDQFFRVEGGHGKCIIDDSVYLIKDGDAIIIPAHAEHNIINTSDTELLQVYTLYSPPHHKDGTIHCTKAAAEASDEKFDGKTTEKMK
jgi:mannose-6-phosphate isomerase-like protein (cupin superfamily)